MRYGVWVLLALVVVLRFFLTQPSYKDGQRLRITGMLSSEPITYTFDQRIILQNLKIYLPRFPEIHYGDFVTIEGTIDKGELLSPKLISLKETNNFLIIFKKKLVSFWQTVLPEPHASLIAGITLGYKSSLPKDFSDNLKKTGTTHVVVASGMNVTFVAGFLMSVLVLIMERRKAICFSLVAILGYCVMTGFEAPIVRAAIMISSVFIAQLLGRLAQTFRVFWFTILIMLIIKPSWIGDIGFILSISATLSLMLFESYISIKLRFVVGLFRESLATSLAAQIITAPILFVTFSQFNILSPIINALVLWVVPLVMIIGSLGGIIGLLIPSLGKFIIYLCYPLTSWFIWVVHFLGNI